MDYLTQIEYEKGVELVNKIETTLNKNLLDNIDFDRDLEMIHEVLSQFYNLGFIPFSKINKIQKEINSKYMGLNALTNSDFESTTKEQWEYILKEVTPYINKAKKRIIPIELENFKTSFANEVLDLLDILNRQNLKFYMGKDFISIPLGLNSKEFMDKDGLYYVFFIELISNKFQISLLLSSDKEGDDIELESDYFGKDGFIYENKASDVWENLDKFMLKIKYGV